MSLTFCKIAASLTNTLLPLQPQQPWPLHHATLFSSSCHLSQRPTELKKPPPPPPFRSHFSPLTYSRDSTFWGPFFFHLFFCGRNLSALFFYIFHHPRQFCSTHRQKKMYILNLNISPNGDSNLWFLTLRGNNINLCDIQYNMLFSFFYVAFGSCVLRFATLFWSHRQEFKTNPLH